MRVILDTNVLLAALVSPYGTSNIVYQAWRAGSFEFLTARIQLEELRRASRYPKLKRLLPPHRVGAMINNLQRAVVMEKLPPLPDTLRINDPDDAFLVALALAGKADYLVTGDRRAGLLEYRNIRRTRVVSPGEFCEEAI